jgi:hypothetical protein
MSLWAPDGLFEHLPEVTLTGELPVLPQKAQVYLAICHPSCCATLSRVSVQRLASAKRSYLSQVATTIQDGKGWRKSRKAISGQAR